MPGTENIHFIRSTKLKGSEALAIDGKRLWDSSASIFSRINALCGDGASHLFAEPTVKSQDDGAYLNVAWFGAYDDDAKEMAAIDRAKLARVEEDLAQRIDALRPALGDPEIGPSVTCMLNIYDHNSIVAVGEHAVITNWGSLPPQAVDSQAAYAKHVDATIGRYLKADLTPRVPGKSWTAYGGLETASYAAQVRSTAASASTAPLFATAAVAPVAGSPAARWWVPLALALFFGAVLAYVAWPGNLVYEKEAVVEQGVLAQLEAANQAASQDISALREELNKEACEIDPTLVELRGRSASESPANVQDNPASTDRGNGAAEQK